jgi:hypothetical protein
MRKRLTRFEWAEIRTAYASDIGLRELGRNMGIPAGTILARAKREGWSKQIQNAKALAKRKDTSPTVTPFEAVSASIQQRGEKHVQRMANVVEKTVPYVEAMEPRAILDCIDDVDTLDKIGRRTFKLDDNSSAGGIDVSILSIGGNVNLGTQTPA